ncbi:MAG: hypothetical protein WAM90_16195, partial [Rhodanobacter sp.]
AGVPTAGLHAVAVSRTEIEKNRLHDWGAPIHQAQDSFSSGQIALSIQSIRAEDQERPGGFEAP